MSYLFVHRAEGREHLLAPGETFESDLGVLEVPADVRPGDAVETHLGETFVVRELRGPDLFAHLERTGAPMMPRDIGLVVGHTGLAAGDRVLDAGTGTGVLAAHMGRLGADVITYEQDPEFASVARENMALAGVADESEADGHDERDGHDRRGTVEVRTGDVTDHLDGLGRFDVVTLDTADAATVVERVPDLVVPGGFVAVYSPFVEQAREAVEAARGADLEAVETMETIQRELDVGERGTRPSTRGVGHTGYLTFARRP